MEDLAWRLRMPLDDFNAALKPLIDGRFFTSSEVLAERKRNAMPETEKDSQSIVDRPARAPSRFEEFWKTYPRRDGPNPRKPAEAEINALVKSDLDPQMLITEVGKFREVERARGNTATRFIPQAVTWLSQQWWADHAAVAFVLEQESTELPIEQAVKLYAKTRVWSRHAGPEPGMLGCRASPELLQSTGFCPTAACSLTSPAVYVKYITSPVLE